MTRSLLIRVAVAAALAAIAPFAAIAQTTAKPPPRLPPNASETSRIPAGVDTGSPATTDSLQLGTPVPPNNAADRTELKTRSAAARAATRPKLPASGADCTKGVIAGSSSPSMATRTTTVAKDPTRVAC